MKTASYFKFSYIILVLLLVLACENGINEDNLIVEKEDRVEVWLAQSKSNKLTLEERKKALEKAFEEAEIKKTETLKSNYFSKIAIEAELLNSDPLFLKVNSKFLNLAVKLKDTASIGEAHWNYGLYYGEKEVIDSAYYHYHKAYENFEAVSNQRYMANMLYNLGWIQGRIKDYTSSEISMFEAIEIYNKLNRPDKLYQCYNYLGLVYMELEEYDRAIFSHNKALDYLREVEDKDTYKEFTLSNLGLVYQKQKNYDKAIDNFEAALNYSHLKQKNINFYARLIDNIAYTNFLKGDTLDILNELNYSLAIRDSMNNALGIVVSKLHLSEFYAGKKDTIQAVQLAKDALVLVNDVENSNYRLETLLLLSKIDRMKASDYLKEYVHLNDSLQVDERKIRNKFTRIRFETDEYIEETEKLSEQKVFISIGFVFMFLLFSLAYFIRVQRGKNKELIFEREQQKANEEIYSLMLKQQSKLEEGRLKERHRIAEDLHDGVLGKIFGTRLGLGFLNIKGDGETVEKHKEYVDELQTIEKEIRAISHELKNEILNSKEDFSKIIEELIKQQSEVGEYKYNFSVQSEVYWDEINDSVKINFYRIIQEALQNVRKYSEASFVKINIALDNKNLNLVVEDNGKGFIVTDKKNGIGLKNMRSRVAKLEGIFKVTSSLNKGTTIFVSCPIENSYDE